MPAPKSAAPVISLSSGNSARRLHATPPQQKDSVAGCEMCHGAGKAHADAEQAAHGDDAKTAAASKLIFSFNANPKQNSARCMQCHETSKQQSQFDHSTHAARGVGCNDCHSPHLTEAAENPRSERIQGAQAKFFSVPSLPEESRWLNSSLLKKSQPELCYNCHGDVRAQFALQTHHRVPEGLMKCTDCHSPHGTSNRHELTQSGWESYARSAMRRSAAPSCSNMPPSRWKDVRHATRPTAA